MTGVDPNRALLVVALGAMLSTGLQFASAQNGAMQSSGAAGSGLQDAKRSRSAVAVSNSTGKPASARSRGAVVLHWRPGASSFGPRDDGASQMKFNFAGADANMWAPGKDSFDTTAQPEGVWSVPSALVTETEETRPEAATAEGDHSEVESSPLAGLSAGLLPNKLTSSETKSLLKAAAVHGGYTLVHPSFGPTAGRPHHMIASEHHAERLTRRGITGSRGLTLKSSNVHQTQDSLADEFDRLNQELKPDELNPGQGIRGSGNSGNKKQQNNTGSGARQGSSGTGPK